MPEEPLKPPQPVAPQDLGSDVRCAILVGGTFDPVHLAHVQIPLKARATLKEPEWRASWLIFVPAAVSPFKVMSRMKSDQLIGHRPSGLERSELVRIAIAGVERACLWTDEIDRAVESPDGSCGPSFTIDTVRRLRSVRPDISLRVLIGADQACSLHRWRECHELIRLAPPLCVLRAPVDTVAALEAGIVASGAWSVQESRILVAGAVETPLMPMSSTQIRAVLAAGTAAREIRELDPRVAAEIDRLGLYR